MYLQEFGAVRPCELSRVDAGAKFFEVDMSYALGQITFGSWDKLGQNCPLFTAQYT